MREIQILSSLDHCNIVKKLGALRGREGKLYLVMEYAKTDLSFELKANPEVMAKDHIKLIMWQLLSATAHMHKSGVSFPLWKVSKTGFLF